MGSDCVIAFLDESDAEGLYPATEEDPLAGTDTQFRDGGDAATVTGSMLMQSLEGRIVEGAYTCEATLSDAGDVMPVGTSTSPPRGSSLPRGRYRRTRPVSSTPSTGPSRAGCGCGTRAPSCRVAGWRSPAVSWSAPPVSSRNATGGPPCSPPPSAVHRTRSSQSTSRSARWSRASTTATAPRSPSSPWRTESRPARASPSRNRCSASAIWRGWRRTRPACATSVRARACPAASTKARWPRDCSGSRRPSTGTTPAGRSSR